MIGGLTMAKKLISFRLDRNLIDFLKEQGAKENRSLNNMVETILKDHYNRIMVVNPKREKASKRK